MTSKPNKLGIHNRTTIVFHRNHLLENGPDDEFTGLSRLRQPAMMIPMSTVQRPTPYISAATALPRIIVDIGRSESRTDYRPMTNSQLPDIVESTTATVRVSLYCTASDKERWTAEAENSGYSSRSEYLFELIQESRRYRAQGFLSREQKQEEIQRLSSKIERLEAELENEFQQDQTLVQSLENPELVRQVLSTRYQSLQEIVRSLLVHDVVAVDGRDPVERALFQLAQREEVEYRRGHGWRLTEDQEDQ